MKRSAHTIARSLLGVATLALLGGCAEKGAGVERGPGSGWVTLIDGRDLAGWKPLNPQNNTWQAVAGVKLDPADDKHFIATPGIGALLNSPAGRTSNIVSERAFGDCEAHIEWVVPKHSNSGVYFQGCYEVQVFDSYGKLKVDFVDAGGIYPEWINEQNVNGHAPLVNAAKAPGEWQSFDVVFRAPQFDASGKKIRNARFEQVLMNGKMVQKDVELKGPTRAGLGSEKAEGPFMLQGDHGPVAFRNFRVRSIR